MPKMTKEKNLCLCPTQTTVFSSRFDLLNCRPEGIIAPSGNNDYINNSAQCQDLYTEDIKKFTAKKSFNEVLSEAYKRLGYMKKFDRVRQCGNFLEFRQYETMAHSGVYGDMKLYNANFCRDRLCPLCAWRRTLKIFGQVSRLVDFLQSDYKFIFLTLTVPNCYAEDLPEVIDRLLKSFVKLMRKKQVKSSIYGYFRSLEVTISKGEFNILTKGTYHPHLHIILAVKPQYFNRHNDRKTDNYISHSEWLEMWRECYGDRNIKNVNVKTCKPKKETAEEKNLSSAVAEVAKYSVKDGDYLIGDFLDIESRVKTLSYSLRGRRLTQYGGCFYNAFKNLGLQDVEARNADLINVDGLNNPDLSYIIYRYEWGAGCYHFVNSQKHINLDIDYPED